MAGTRISPVVISDDDEPAAPIAAANPEAQQRQGSDGGNGDDLARPEWLPADFVVGIERRNSDGSVIQDYTCPAGFRFTSKAEVLLHVSSGALQRALDAKATLSDMTTLQGKYDWFRAYRGWVLEIRAGGHNMSKMFKFYAHLRYGLRIASKEDFMSYLRTGIVPERANDECDTSRKDNIIAHLKFHIKRLPPGWIKETKFSDNGNRKDRFFTDPVTQKVYRSKKLALQYFNTGTAKSHNPRESVTDMYMFDSCTDLLPSLANKLKIEGAEDHQSEEASQSLCRKKRGTSSGFDQPRGKKPKTEKKRENGANTDAKKPSRPGGRPRKS